MELLSRISRNLRCIITVVTVLSAVSPMLGDGYSDADLNQYMEDAIADYQLKLHKATQTMQKRVRREITTEDFREAMERTAFMSDIVNITAWQSIPTSYAMELEPFKINNDNYMAVVNFKSKSGGYRTNSAVYLMDVNKTFHLLQNFSTSGGIDFEFADLGREQYAIFLDHVGQNWYGGADKYTYMKSFQMNQFLPSENKNRPFQYRTKVRALGAKKVKVFTKSNKHYFVTANSYHEMGDMYHVKSTMHVQTAYGYELVQEFTTQGAQDVEVEVIDGKRFICFANQMDNAGKVDIYSTVYIENPNQRMGNEPFTLYQRIGTHGARDFEYFSFDGNHYLAVANQYTQVRSMDVKTGRPIVVNDYQVNSVIYWWTGKMWVQWQLIPTNGAVKWSFFKSSFGDPMLVVSNTKSAPIIFTYDWMRGIFVPTQVQDLSPFPGQDVVADTRSVLPFTTNDKELFLAVANYDPKYTSGYNVFKVTFERKPAPKVDPSIPEIITTHLEKMRFELGNVQESLLSLLEEVTNKVMTITTDQTITAPVVTLQNVTITDTLSTSNFFYRQNTTYNPMDASRKEMERLRQRLLEQENKMAVLQLKFDEAVLLNKDTTIKGKKIITKDIHIEGNLTTNVLNISGLIDQTKLEDLDKQTWKKSKDQHIHGNYSFTSNITVVDGNVDELNGRRISSMMTTNTEQTITGMKTFNETVDIDKVAMENFTVNGLNIPQDIVIRNAHQTIIGMKNFQHLDVKRLELSGLVNGVNITDFNERKMTLTTEQRINSIPVFNEGFSSSSGMVVGGLVDGVNLTAIARNMSDKVETLAGPKTFKSVRVEGSVFANKMNGFNLRNIFTLNTTQRVSAKMNFTSRVTIFGDVITNSTVNGLDLSEQVVTKHGNQTIGGHKNFLVKTSVLGNVSAKGRIDGVDVQDWKRSAVTKHAQHPVTGQKMFVDGVEITDQLKVKILNNMTMASLKEDKLIIGKNETKWINRFNFETFSVDTLHASGRINEYRVPDDFVLLNSSGPVSGSKTFLGETKILGNMFVNGYLSGKNFSLFYDSVFKNNTDEFINSDVYFLQNLKCNNVNVTGKINRFSIPDGVITTSTYQNITNKLSFTTDGWFESSVDAYVIKVNETVNDVDVAELERNAIYKDRNQTINGTIIFVGGIDCKQNLSVAGLINGINLTELITTSVRVSRAQNITGSKVFEEDVMFQSPLTSPGTVNNVNISNLNSTSLKNKGNQIVHSNITINGDVTVTNSVKLTNTSRINNINFVSFVENAAKTDLHNTIKGDLIYTDVLLVTKLNALVVDGVNMTDILLTRSNQSVTGYLTFSYVSVNYLSINGLINNVDILRLHEKSLKLRTQQNITGRYTFLSVHVIGNVNISGVINEVDLIEFNSSAVHLTGDEVISGKYFENVTFGDVTFVGLLNGVNVSLLFSDALRKTGNQEICHVKTFVNSVVSSNARLDNVHVTDYVNGVNITDLDQKAVKLNDPKKLHGTYYFKDGLEIIGNITIKEKLNNKSLPVDFMTTFGDQEITGFKNFTHMQFLGHLNVTGLIDSVNISDVYQKGVSLTGDQKISRSLHFQSAIFEGDVIFPNKSTVNNIDISASLVPVNKDAVINGNKKFNSTYVGGNLDVATGIVNGVNLKKLSESTLKKSSPTMQKISGDQRFLQHLFIDGNLVVSELINGVRVSDVEDYSEDIGNTIKNELLDLTHDARKLCNATTNILPIAITEQVLTGIEKIDVFQSFPTDVHLGTIHSTIIGDTVFISVARAPGAPCGPAYILKCTPTLQCTVHQTIMTNAPTLEFFAYQTFDAVLVSHWKSGSNDTIGCKQEPELYVYNQILGYYVAYQTLNYVLFESEFAPFVTSSIILAAYFGKYRQTSAANPFKQLPVEIKFFKRNGKNYLVVGSYEDNSYFVDILYIKGKNLASLKLEQRIKTDGIHVSVGELTGGKLIIATSTDGPQGNIKLYLFNEKNQKFVFYQRLRRSASTVKLQMISDKPFLLYASTANGFGLCEWRGVSGYGACTTLQITDTRSVETIITPSGAYTVAGTRKSIAIYQTKFAGNNKPYEEEVC